MKSIGVVSLISTFLYLSSQVTLANDFRATTLIEQEKLFKVGAEEDEYDKVTDEDWAKFTPEKRCQLIIDKLENDLKRSASSAKDNLVVYTILRPVPVDDSGECFKRIILWHFEKVELIKSDKNILNYEDILPVRLLLLGMSPNQIEKEPRDLAEIPEFLEIACKELLSQKPRMRWPLSGARYHPYISNIVGFQKVWIYRVSELLSTCAQHTYQSLNGYIIMLLVSTEQMVDDRIFGDYQNAWKGRHDQRNKEEIVVDMDGKDKRPAKQAPKMGGGSTDSQGRKVIDFDIPEGAEKIDARESSLPRSKRRAKVDIEVIKPPSSSRVVYSPEKLPVYEIPNSVTSEVCLEVGTKEIPGLSRYKQFPAPSSVRGGGFSSIIVPSNRAVERPKYTPIQPVDRANINLQEYRNFWRRPNYVSKYRDPNSLRDYLVERTRLHWPEAPDSYLDFENENFVKPYLHDSKRYYRVDPDPQLLIAPRGGGGQYFGGDDGPLLQPFQSLDLADSYDYGSTDNDPQIQRFAYFDNNELPEEDGGFGDQHHPDSLFSFPAQRRESVLAGGRGEDPLLRVDFQGMTGKRVNKQPFLGFEGEDSFQDWGDSSSSQDDNSVSYSKFRDIARNAVVKWYLDDDSGGDARLTGRDRKAIKKLFSYIEEVDPDQYAELAARGDDYIVRKVMRIGRSKDGDLQSILAARKSRSGANSNYYGVYKEKQSPTGILASKSAAKSRGQRRSGSRRKGRRSSRRRGGGEDAKDSGSGSEFSSDSAEIPKDIFIQDILAEKYDFKNILKKQRLKRLQKLLKDVIAARMSSIEKKKMVAPTKNLEILKSSVESEQKNRDQLEKEYKKNLEEHAKILDLLKKNQERLREKMEEEHRKKQEELRNEMKGSVGQLEEALNTASGAIGEIEKEKRFLDERLKGLEGDNKHIRTLISMKDNYIKKMEKSRIELETKQEMEMKEMKESYERQLSELRSNLSKDDTITGLSNMVSSLEHEAKRNLEKLEESTLNDEKIKQAIEQRLRDRERQLELAYQKQKQRDTDYLNYVLQILDSKESEDARRVIKELRGKILELEERQEELQHTREELEMINNDLIQTVEEQNKGLGELMKKVEDLKIEKEKAQDELSLAKEKYNDIKQVERRLKDQLEEVKRSGSPSEDILRHLQRSLDVAEEERRLASEVVRSAELNFGNTEKNVKIATDKLERMRMRAGIQKAFEKELKDEIERRLNSNRNALAMSGRGETGQGDYLMNSDIKPLSDKEKEELDRLRSLGLDELSDDEKKKLLILGQRQLATMELSVASTFGDLNNMISKALDKDEVEKSKVLWNQVSDSSVNRMEVENSLGEILLEKIEGQDRSLNNMKSLLEETQNTISELNKQLIIQRELSEEASHLRNMEMGGESKDTENSSDIGLHRGNQGEEAEDSNSNKVFEELSNDILFSKAARVGEEESGIRTSETEELSNPARILSPPLSVEESAQANSEVLEDEKKELSALKFRRELESKIKEMTAVLPGAADGGGLPQSSSGEDASSGKGGGRAPDSAVPSSLGRKEHVSSPMSIQRMMMSDYPEFDSKKTLVANTEYENNVNQHNHPLHKEGEEGGVLSESLYMLHDVQKERPPSPGITCDNIISTIKRSLDAFSQTYDSGKPLSQSEVMTRTVLPGLQYDQCYNSTMMAFEDFQERMMDSGVFVRVFVLLTDFMDSLMIGDIGRTGYIMSNIPYVIYRVLGETIASNSGGGTATGTTAVTGRDGSETIETVIRNFPSEWIHEHMRTCKDILSGKSLEEIAKSKGNLGVYSPMRSPTPVPGRGGGGVQEGLKGLPPIFLANVEVSPRPDKEPCIRIIKRIKQRISEVNGLLVRKRELQEKLRIKDAQGKLFIFSFEDILPYNPASPGTSQYCEKYLSELFIKMNNMEWRAKPANNSLVRLITIPTSSDPQKVSIQEEAQINLSEWKREALRLAFDPSISNECMGNSLVEHLTNKRITKSSGFFSSEAANALTINLLDAIRLKDDLSREILMQHGWGGSGGTGSEIDQGGGFLSRIFNSGEQSHVLSGREFKAIPGVLLILRTSDQIPPNTMINPLLLSLKPDESPYLIETVRNKRRQSAEETTTV